MKAKLRAAWDWFADKGYLVVIGVIAAFAVAYGLATGQGAGALKKLLAHRRELDTKRRDIRAETARGVRQVSVESDREQAEVETAATKRIGEIEADAAESKKESDAKIQEKYDATEGDDRATRSMLDGLIAGKKPD